LEWSLNQHPGILGVACDSSASFERNFVRCKPSLVLLNRKLAERVKFASPGKLAPIRDNVPALTYSLAADGDQLFVSTPGGAAGYLLRRVKPDRLLEPLLQGNYSLPGNESKELLARVKSYFKELLQPRPAGAAYGIDRLTRRENEVLGLLSKGCVDKEIAQALGISAWTVHGHIKSIFERLHVRTRTEAVVRYLEK
jgi:DNA-binding NarL/FixJ family response regulator